MSPAATRARIRVEETVSPSTSTSGTTRVSNSECASSIAGSPLALAPKRKFSPTETCLASSFARAGRASMNSSALCFATSSSKGMTTSSSTPSPSITSRLTAKGMISFGSRRRMQDLERVRVEGEDGVGAVDHRLVAEVDAVEGADRDVARARLGVGQRGDLDAHRIASATAGTSSATRSTADLLARVLDPEGADRGAPQLRAVGVVEGLEQGADVGPGRALDLVVGVAVLAGEQLGAVDLDVALGRLHHLAAVGLLVEPLAADPDRRGHRHPLADGAGRQLQRSRQPVPVSVSSPSGSPVLERQPRRAVAR